MADVSRTTGTRLVKRGLAEMLKGGVIMDVVTPDQARIAEDARAMTATAPASSAIRAWSGVTTSMITPPLSISAKPRLTSLVPVSYTHLTLPTIYSV